MDIYGRSQYQNGFFFVAWKCFSWTFPVILVYYYTLGNRETTIFYIKPAPLGDLFFSGEIAGNTTKNIIDMYFYNTKRLRDCPS